jgi:hypothetical protein
MTSSQYPPQDPKRLLVGGCRWVQSVVLNLELEMGQTDRYRQGENAKPDLWSLAFGPRRRVSEFDLAAIDFSFPPLCFYAGLTKASAIPATSSPHTIFVQNCFVKINCCLAGFFYNIRFPDYRAAVRCPLCKKNDSCPMWLRCER